MVPLLRASLEKQVWLGLRSLLGSLKLWQDSFLPVPGCLWLWANGHLQTLAMWPPPRAGQDLAVGSFSEASRTASF